MKNRGYFDGGGGGGGDGEIEGRGAATTYSPPADPQPPTTTTTAVFKHRTNTGMIRPPKITQQDVCDGILPPEDPEDPE